MKKSAIVILMLLCSEISLGQQAMTSLQAVYDRGLVSFEHPLLANRNAALILAMNQFQVGIDFNFSHHNRSIISVAGPLGYNFAMGLSWDRIYYENLTSTPIKVTQFSKHFNRFRFAAAFTISKNMKMAHQLSITTDVENDATLMDLTITDRDSLWDKDRFWLEGNYQLGLLWEPAPKIKFGMVTPIIIGLSQLETRIAKFETKTETDYNFWGKKCWRANLPELAIEYEPTPAIALAAVLGKNDDRPLLHLGAKTNLINRFLLAAGYEHFDIKNNNVLVGIGSFFGGFHGFYSYDVSNQAHRLSLSFSPQQQKQLVQLSDFEQQFGDIFSYKVRYYQTHSFISGKLKNLTGENVSLHLELSGRGIHKFKESFTLSPRAQQQIQINFPTTRQKISAMTTNYRVRIVAFQRERQVIEKTVPVQIRDVHQWNGALADLVYFIQTDIAPITTAVTKIKANFSASSEVIQYARAVFDFISNNFSYQQEPAMQQTDYVQFPVETLSKKSGDCEDLCLLFCSLVGAMGIPTALVEINFPEKSEDAHILVLVNTGLKPVYFDFVQTNPRRYVFTANADGNFTAWLPVELTLVGASFDQAWQRAAEQYYHYAVFKGGLASGWVRMVAVF